MGIYANGEQSRTIHVQQCKPHVGTTQETTWLLSAYGTSGQPGEAKPNSSQAQTKPRRYSRACCRKLLFEEVELLLGWLVGISMWIATLALMPSHVPEISAIPTWWSLCGRNWSKIWHPQEVCCGGKVSSHGGYKKACSSLCSFLFCSSSDWLFIHLVSLLFCRSHSLLYTIPLSLPVSLISFLYPNCSYQ